MIIIKLSIYQKKNKKNGMLLFLAKVELALLIVKK